MSATDDHTPRPGIRGWWATPRRSGLARSIAPWEYRHLRVSAIVRGVCGSLLVTGGLAFLSYGADALAAVFMAVGMLNLAGFGWYLRPAPADTKEDS